MGPSASQASSQLCRSVGPARKAAMSVAIIGSQSQGRTNRASPPNAVSGPSRLRRAPPARPPWKAKLIQPCCAFQSSTGENTSAATRTASHGCGRASRRGWVVARKTSTPAMGSTAVYFDSSARPAHRPAPSHQRNAGPCTRQSAMPSSAQSSGPSGSTQLAELRPNTGERLKANAAQSAARWP